MSDVHLSGWAVASGWVSQVGERSQQRREETRTSTSNSLNSSPVSAQLIRTNDFTLASQKILTQNSGPASTSSSGDDFGKDFRTGIAPVLASGVIGAFGFILGKVITSTPWGIAASAVIGCLSNIVGTRVSDNMTGNQSGAGAYVGACAGGAVTGVVDGIGGVLWKNAMVPK